ncbi:MAG: metallophosphoesterase [Minicystis sp.]
MSARFFVFFIVVVAVLGMASRYLLRRTAGAFGLGPAARRGIGGVLFGALVVIALARVLERWVPEGVLDPVASAGFAVVLGVGISAVVLGVTEVAVGVVRIGGRWRGVAGEPGQRGGGALGGEPTVVALAGAGAPTVVDLPPEQPTVVEVPTTEPTVVEVPAVPRRTFFAQAAVGSSIAFGGGSSLYGAAIGRHDYALEEVPIRIGGLSPALDGFTIVQLSDVHLGLFVREREIRAAEDLVRRARADLIVLTGNLLDHDARAADALGRMITRLLPLSRGGVIAIPGNHDYYAGIDAFSDAVTGAGARLLRNDGLVIGGPGGFALLGVDDVMGPRNDRRSRGPDLPMAIERVPMAKDLPRILLCHNPVTFAANVGKVALQLSGHTHGGQVNVGVRLAPLVLGHPYIAGRYELGGSQNLREPRLRHGGPAGARGGSARGDEGGAGGRLSGSPVRSPRRDRQRGGLRSYPR